MRCACIGTTHTRHKHTPSLSLDSPGEPDQRSRALERRLEEGGTVCGAPRAGGGEAQDAGAGCRRCIVCAGCIGRVWVICMYVRYTNGTVQNAGRSSSTRFNAPARSPSVVLPRRRKAILASSTCVVFVFG